MVRKPNPAHRESAPTPNAIKYYARWCCLRYSDDYCNDSEGIRALQVRLDAAESAGNQDEWSKLSKQLDREEQRIANKFGLFMWWDPDDKTISIHNVGALFDLSPVPHNVQIVAPSEPMSPDGWNRHVDGKGWLILRVNLRAPIQETLPIAERIMSLCRKTLAESKQRTRADSLEQALRVYGCYSRYRKFAQVGAVLGLPVSTVKGQFVRGCVLVHGKPPTGTMKQRRARDVGDPAHDFQSHLPSCARCQKAKSVEDMCSRFSAFAVQDTVSLRECLSSSPSSRL
jgi:hypothetical protein